MARINSPCTEICKNQQGKPIRRMCVLCHQKKRQILERQQARKNERIGSPGVKPAEWLSKRRSCAVLEKGGWALRFPVVFRA
ncbi:hypothetical protein WN51_12706 [Melipona quadrifasciata]|uniref:Uncharacterized protein n=1 Tax=Melipona quadrifasciata TaxID=166423 RepID=A0A0N0U5F0_9HYME|nr:hypothetical protein WN51_12706 [Melipona quadrifasciata]